MLHCIPLAWNETQAVAWHEWSTTLGARNIPNLNNISNTTAAPTITTTTTTTNNNINNNNHNHNNNNNNINNNLGPHKDG